MLVYEVVEDRDGRRGLFATEDLAKEFVRVTYGDVHFYGRDEGHTGAMWFGPTGSRTKDTYGYLHAVWVWNRQPSADEQRRMERLLRRLNDRGEAGLVWHLAYLRNEDRDGDEDDGPPPGEVTERGTALLEAIMLAEITIGYCGGCPGTHGLHKMSCSYTKGRLSIPVTMLADGKFQVTGPYATTLPAPPDEEP